jgi:hypothetical protein
MISNPGLKAVSSNASPVWTDCFLGVMIGLSEIWSQDLSNERKIHRILFMMMTWSMGSSTRVYMTGGIQVIDSTKVNEDPITKSAHFYGIFVPNLHSFTVYLIDRTHIFVLQTRGAGNGNFICDVRVQALLFSLCFARRLLPSFKLEIRGGSWRSNRIRAYCIQSTPSHKRNACRQAI